MNQLLACPNFSPKYHIADQGRFTALQLIAKPIHSVLNQCRSGKAINCSQRVSASKIRNWNSINNRNCKILERCCCIPVKPQDGYASKFDEDDDGANLQEALNKQLNALYRLIRPRTMINCILGTTSAFLLAIVNITDLNATFFKELLKVAVPTALMNIHVASLNQLCDLEIDKINKPDRPLTSNDLSMGVAIAIALMSLSMSLAMGIMFKSPPQIVSLLIQGFFGTAYSVDFPFLRWKKNAFLAASCVVIPMGISIPLLCIHTQKYVLRRPIVITKSLIFTTTFMAFFGLILVLLKDVPDVDGDREHGIQTLSIIIGKERVFWLCVRMLVMAYGAAVMFVVSSSFLLSSKLVILLSHSTIACILWRRALSTDLSTKASFEAFYLFIWKLGFAEFLLLPFVR